jgi:hypothetical protein
MQAPTPSQVEASWRWLVADEHDGGAHTVPARCLRHAPLPSQVPSVPQVAAVCGRQAPRGSAAPLPTRLHVPGCPAEHDRQGPVQASVQHTPSTQKPLPHWVPSVQGWPGPFLPQLPATQVAPGAQATPGPHPPLQAPLVQV